MRMLLPAYVCLLLLLPQRQLLAGCGTSTETVFDPIGNSCFKLVAVQSRGRLLLREARQVTCAEP
jgi:hypothetical protein